MNDYGNGPSTGLEQTAAGKIATGLPAGRLHDRAADRQCCGPWPSGSRQSPPPARWRKPAASGRSSTAWKGPARWSSATPRTAGTRSSPRPRCSAGASSPAAGKWTSARKSSGARSWATTSRWNPTSTFPTRFRPTIGDSRPSTTRPRRSGSYVWDGAIKDYAADLKKLHSPRFEIDWETTHGCVEIARDVFGDLLPVRLKGVWWWSLGLTCLAATFRGLQNMLCDFIENPDELKELLSIVSRGHLDKLDYLESHGLLSLNNDGTYVGSGGFGFSDELPQAGFRRPRPRPATCGASPRARRPCTSRRRCTRSSSSPTSSRSWSGSG